MVQQMSVPGGPSVLLRSTLEQLPHHWMGMAQSHRSILGHNPTNNKNASGSA